MKNIRNESGITWREKIPNVFNHIIKNKMYDEIY